MKPPVHMLICLDCPWHDIADLERISDSVALHMRQNPSHKSFVAAFVAAEETPEESEFDG